MATLSLVDRLWEEAITSLSGEDNGVMVDALERGSDIAGVINVARDAMAVVRGTGEPIVVDCAREEV